MIKKLRVLFLIFVGFFAFNALAKIEEQLSWKTYPVHLTGKEKTSREVRRAIHNYSPLAQWFPDSSRHYDGRDGDVKPIGLTHSSHQFASNSRQRNDGVCQLNTYTITDTTAIYLPAIAGDQKLPKAVKSFFAKEYERIKKHELTHHAYNQSYLQKFDRYLSTLPYDSSCAKLEKTIRDYNNELVEYTGERHKIFDDAEFKYDLALQDYERRVALATEAGRIKKEAAQQSNQAGKMGLATSKTVQKFHGLPYWIRVLFVVFLFAGTFALVMLLYFWKRRKK